MQTTYKLRETNSMNESLKTLVAAGVVSEREAKAAHAWAVDVAESAPRVPRRPEYARVRAPGSGRGSQSTSLNMMAAGRKRRLAKVRGTLAGIDSPWFKSAYHLAVLGKPATETAALLELTMPAFIIIVQDAFRGIASVYNFVEGQAA
jgi:hypothetical protein